MITPAHDQRIARAALLLAGEVVRFHFENDTFDVLAEFRERLADPTIMAGIRALAESERRMEAAQLNHHRGGEEKEATE